MAKKEKNKSFLSSLISNPFVRTIVLMAIISGALVALFLYGLNVYTKHGEAVAVPSVKGMQESEAAQVLRKASLGYEIIESVYLTDGTPGAIIDQIPEEGSNVKKERVIFLTIQAKDVEMVTIPSLVDFSQRQAIATLHSLGFMKVAVEEIPSAYRGLVLDVKYKGKSVELNNKVPKGHPLTLIVGAGGEVVIDSLIDIIPDVDALDSHDNAPTVDNSFFD